MSGYDNTNRGALFVNDRKDKETSPDYKGSINIDGKEYWLSGWKSQIKKGDKAGQNYLSLSISPKDGARGGYSGGGPSRSQQPSSTNGNPSLVNNEEDVPF